MADLTQTAANVGLSGSATVAVVQVGEAVDQGEVGRLNSSDNKYYLADSTTSTNAAAKGVYLTPAALDGYAVIALSGTVDLGATLTVGTAYYLSGANAGKISPEADLGTGDYVTQLGVATAADAIELTINASGTAKP